MLTSKIERLLLKHFNVRDVDVEERLDGLLALDLANSGAGHLTRAVNTPAEVTDRRRRVEQNALVQQTELPKSEQGRAKRLHKFHVAQAAFALRRIAWFLETTAFILPNQDLTDPSRLKFLP